MQIEGITPQPLGSAAGNTPGQAKEQGRLKDACSQFESLFLSQMFQEMRKSIPKNDFLGGGRDEETFNAMLDDERAKAWAQADGVGIANVLYQQLRNTL